MAKVENLARLRSKLRSFQTRFGNQQAAKDGVTVGFVQSYAIYVHENKEANHIVGQAKFLEQPARALRQELAQIVTDVTTKTRNLGRGLLMAGLRLQREAQQLTPVDTGALKGSAFTCPTPQVEEVAAQAYGAAESLREKKMKARATKQAKKKGKS